MVSFCLFVNMMLRGDEILNEILTSVKGHNCITNVRKMMCNNSNLDLVDTNAYTKFDEILSFVLKILSGNYIMTDGQMV